MQRILYATLRDKENHRTVSPGKGSILSLPSLSSAHSPSSQGFGSLAESKQLACTFLISWLSMAWVPTSVSFQCHFSCVLNSRPGKLQLAAGGMCSEDPAVPMPGAFLPKDLVSANPRGHPLQQVKCPHGISPAPFPLSLPPLISFCLLQTASPSPLELVALLFALITCPPKSPHSLLLPGKTAMPSFENDPHVTERSFHYWVAFFFHPPIIRFAWISHGSCSITLPMRTVCLCMRGVFREILWEGGRVAATPKPCSSSSDIAPSQEGQWCAQGWTIG